ncbi:MAG: helix-turn-helix transcriptional regulator [Planctomycetota bacterium]|nr:helix-turn-helix transcriptional regulator [Planctomycetota bacterium]MDA1179771.1 helix-turn-helix transcriptional regulator [Planctomycetota bacterium]
MSPRRAGEVHQGATEMLVLGAIQDQPLWGYEIQKRISLASSGLVNVKVATLYPLLHHLEEQGLVSSQWKTVDGRKRRMYRLSAKGKKRLHGCVSDWKRLTTCVQSLLGGALKSPSA